MAKEKEEMWRRQQEILAERRSGSNKQIKEAEKRRQRVKDEIKAKEDEKQKLREALARGERPKQKAKKLYSDEDNELGIVIPLAPFGIPKYDDGERFDLRLPYVEQGWVDEDADPFKWVKNIFGKKDKKDSKDRKKDDKSK